MHVFKLTVNSDQLLCVFYITCFEHEIFTLHVQSVKRAASDLKGQPEL